MTRTTHKAGQPLGTHVILGFILVFLATLVTNAVFGIGVSQLMKWISASPNLRVYLGSTFSYLARLAAVVFFSMFALQKVLGIDAKSTLFPFKAGWWKKILYGFLLGAGVMILLFLVEVAVGWLLVDGWIWQQLSLNAWLRNLWLAVLVNLFVAVGEEVMFRGYLLTGLEKAWGKWFGLIVMAILFSVPHLFVEGAQESNWLLFTILLALPGLVLGWAYLQSRSLWLPIGIHFGWNFFQDEMLNLVGEDKVNLVGAITRQQGPEWFMGTSYGIEVGLAGILAVILVLLGVWIWSSKS